MLSQFTFHQIATVTAPLKCDLQSKAADECRTSGNRRSGARANCLGENKTSLRKNTSLRKEDKPQKRRQASEKKTALHHAWGGWVESLKKGSRPSPRPWPWPRPWPRPRPWPIRGPKKVNFQKFAGKIIRGGPRIARMRPSRGVILTPEHADPRQFSGKNKVNIRQKNIGNNKNIKHQRGAPRSYRHMPGLSIFWKLDRKIGIS